MAITRKVKKLLRQPRAFFADAQRNRRGGLVQKDSSVAPQKIVAPRKEVAETVASAAKSSFDLWHLYRIQTGILGSQHFQDPVVIVFPVGVPSIDATRLRNLKNAGNTAMLLPVWQYCAADVDMDDFEYAAEKDLPRLSDILNCLLAWCMSHNIEFFAVPYEHSVFARSLIMRMRAAGVPIICDLPHFLPDHGAPLVDAHLDCANDVVESNRNEGMARAIANVGGNDSVRVLMLPARQMAGKDATLRAAVTTQIEAALAACLPTDHLVVIAKRRKRGFIEAGAYKKLVDKYRKSLIWYDNLHDIDPLFDIAIDIRAPDGYLPKRLRRDDRVTIYEIKNDTSSDDTETELTPRYDVFANVNDALAAAEQTPWPSAPLDHRDWAIARTVSGIGLSLLAVPDVTHNRQITNGRQRHLETLLNADGRCYGASKQANMADVVIQWGAEPNESKERPEKMRSLLGAPRLYLEDGFIRSLGLWTDPDEPTCSVVMDTRSVYYDATKPSLLETILASDFKVPSREQKRARTLINKIADGGVSKYNYAPFTEIDFRQDGKRTILLIDQKVGDMSIKYGAADSQTFDDMLDAAIALGDEVEIVIKQHPCAIDGTSGDAHFSEARMGEIAKRPNVHLIGFDINPYALFSAVDDVWVVTSGMGIEALMAGKDVTCFGMPFYAGWGATTDKITCHRRSRNRSLEDIFYVFYVMLSRYVHPETGEPTDIENVITYFADHVARPRR